MSGVHPPPRRNQSAGLSPGPPWKDGAVEELARGAHHARADHRGWLARLIDLSVSFRWIVALLLGGVTWLISSKLIAITGAQREVTEGVTALVSAGLLLYVGFWLHNKANAAKWSDFIRGQISTAVKGGTLFGFALVSFFAVYREVFETVLFYQALWLESEGSAQTAVLAGFGVGTAALIVIAWLIARFSVRLPLGLFFGASSVLLAIMAVVFAKLFMSAYPVLMLDQTMLPADQQPDRWTSAMTYKFVGALRSLTDDNC